MTSLIERHAVSCVPIADTQIAARKLPGQEAERLEKKLSLANKELKATSARLSDMAQRCSLLFAEAKA